MVLAAAKALVEVHVLSFTISPLLSPPLLSPLLSFLLSSPFSSPLLSPLLSSPLSSSTLLYSKDFLPLLFPAPAEFVARLSSTRYSALFQAQQLPSTMRCPQLSRFKWGDLPRRLADKFVTRYGVRFYFLFMIFLI